MGGTGAAAGRDIIRVIGSFWRASMGHGRVRHVSVSNGAHNRSFSMPCCGPPNELVAAKRLLLRFLTVAYGSIKWAVSFGKVCGRRRGEFGEQCRPGSVFVESCKKVGMEADSGRTPGRANAPKQRRLNHNFHLFDALITLNLGLDAKYTV